MNDESWLNDEFHKPEVQQHFRNLERLGDQVSELLRGRIGAERLDEIVERLDKHPLAFANGIGLWADTTQGAPLKLHVTISCLIDLSEG